MQLEIKSVGEDGTFSGVLSPYGNVDQGGDMVMPGAFTKSLQENGGRVPMLWQHQQDCPIGDLTLTDHKDGLHCAGKFCLETGANGAYMVPEAAKAYALVKNRMVKGLSIGYDAVQKAMVKGVRQLSEIKLWEGSVVTFPMNLDAGIAAVKEGRRLSAATRTKLGDLRTHLSAAADLLGALETEEAAEPDNQTGKDVPAEAAGQIESMRALLSA